MMEIKKLISKEYNMSIQDVENIIRAMTLEDIEPGIDEIKKYIESYDSRSINIKVTKNTQRILNSFKIGRETYEDVILRKMTEV